MLLAWVSMTTPSQGPRARSGEILDPADGRGGYRGGDPRRPRSDQEATGRFPWVGVLLVLLGVALLVRQLAPAISFGDLLLLALGLAFAGAWLVAHQRWALVPAILLLALALPRLLRDVGVIGGDGWTPLFLGAALLLVWAIGRAQQRAGHGWALWLGGLFVVVGLFQLSDRIPGIPDLGALWPLIIIGAGLALIVGSQVAARRSTG